MPASLDDILTTQKNGVLGVNAIVQALTRGQGQATSQVVSGSTTVVFSGSGYLVSYNVLSAGSGAGTIYNSNNVNSTPSIDRLSQIEMVLGFHSVGVAFTNGLTVSPGTGQEIVLTYSLG